MAKLTNAAFFLALMTTAAVAQMNAGNQTPEAAMPFTMTQVATFNLPWRIAFLPDGRMLVTEKVGPVWLVTQKGEKTPVANAPAVLYGGQGGMLGIYVSPHYKTDHSVYLTYSEPQEAGGSSLALAKAQLKLGNGSASLENLKVIWHDGEGGKGGQFGAAVAFAPDGKSLFLTSGDRQRFWPAQDPNSPTGKILHLTLDGKAMPDNPNYGKTGAATLNVIDPPKDTEVGKTAPVVRTYTFPGPNETPSETWTIGHRTPYGLAFAPNGELWELEHGPKGSDKLNLIVKGNNYGWPAAAYATNYDGVPIPTFDGHPEFTKPVIQWTPVIAPGNFTFYNGKMFADWKGSALIGGMATKAIVRVVFDGKGGATTAERWDVGHRIRDLAVAPDGAIWAAEDDKAGGLFRITPK
jgi:glucose/arabinose dehydrogenase